MLWQLATNLQSWSAGTAPLCGRASIAQQGASAAPLLEDESGSVFVEYTVLLCVLALACTAAVVGLGVPLLRYFQDQINLVLLSFP